MGLVIWNPRVISGEGKRKSRGKEKSHRKTRRKTRRK